MSGLHPGETFYRRHLRQQKQLFAVPPAASIEFLAGQVQAPSGQPKNLLAIFAKLKITG